MSDESLPWLVVGLGNPGREYARNRHNVGFMTADLLASRLGVRFGRHRRAVADVAEGRLRFGAPGSAEFASGLRLVIVKPLTYMNLSGGPVAGLARFYKVPPNQLIAIHDDLDIPYGQVRAKLGGGEGGHNGLRSLSRSLGTKDYLRVRVGVGRPPGRQDPADFVLTDFSAAERKELEFVVDRAADVAEAVITRGLEWAQNSYHGV
ncbi:MAG TPA: aminoacyl-tRNA hydrolase [Micromonosporaceae bacterium]|nr:aminoacyl-tRNA hydrolase [Micromonosporaceae bacterium]